MANRVADIVKNLGLCPDCGHDRNDHFSFPLDGITETYGCMECGCERTVRLLRLDEVGAFKRWREAVEAE